MRVLHVLDHSLPLHSGYTFRTLRIIQGQRALGFETQHVTSIKQGQTTHDIEHSHDLAFIRTKASGFWQKIPVLRQLIGVIALRKNLEEIVKKEKPDILHVHSPVLNGLAALGIAKRYHIPMVYEVRAFWEDAAVDHGTHRENGLRYKLSRALESYIVKRANHVTTICEGLKKDLIERGLAADKVTVVANAVDHEAFVKVKVSEQSKKDLITRYGLHDKFVIGFIGSLYAYEGVQDLFEAIARLKVEMPRLRCLIVGGGPEEDKLKQLIKRLELDNIVFMVGRVPHDEVPTYYDLCDLCVYPRKRLRLTELVTPLKPLEAMARGVPVLASDVGGHRELIESDVTGFLFKADDLDSLTATLHQCIKNRKPMEVIFKAKNYVLEKRNWQTTTKAYQDVFANL